MDKINLYVAIDRMREISANGGTFALKFRKWNRATRNGGDLANIAAARVRPKAREEDIANAGHKLFFTDVATGRALNCWHPLIVEFNGMEVTL